MKKFISSALVFVMLLSLCMLSSCGRETAYSLLTEAQEKMSQLDSYETNMKTDIQIDMGMMGGKITIPFEINTKVSGMTEDNLVALTSMKVANQTMVTYQEGDWTYTVSDGVGTKSKIDRELEARFASFSEEETMKELFSEENLKDVEIVKNEDGTRSISVAIPDEVFEKIMDFILEELSKTIPEDSSIGGFDIDVVDAVMDFAVNEEGYISHYGMKGNVRVSIIADETAGGMSISMEMPLDMTCPYVNPGTAVTITPPDGYQNFAESDSGSDSL